MEKLPAKTDIQRVICSASIYDAANAVIALDTSRLEKTLHTTKKVGKPIMLVGFRNGEKEAAGIAGEIRRRATEGLPWQDITVLYR